MWTRCLTGVTAHGSLTAKMPRPGLMTAPETRRSWWLPVLSLVLLGLHGGEVGAAVASTWPAHVAGGVVVGDSSTRQLRHVVVAPEPAPAPQDMAAQAAAANATYVDAAAALSGETVQSHGGSSGIACGVTNLLVTDTLVVWPAAGNGSDSSTMAAAILMPGEIPDGFFAPYLNLTWRVGGCAPCCAAALHQIIFAQTPDTDSVSPGTCESLPLARRHDCSPAR